MTLRFEWDPRKAASNLRRHGVSFDEAASVFSDVGADPRRRGPPIDEQREIIVGHSTTRERLLLISFTERENAIRIIGARKATRNERKDYKEGVRA